MYINFYFFTNIIPYNNNTSSNETVQPINITNHLNSVNVYIILHTDIPRLALWHLPLESIRCVALAVSTITLKG